MMVPVRCTKGVTCCCQAVLYGMSLPDRKGSEDQVTLYSTPLLKWTTWTLRGPVLKTHSVLSEFKLVWIAQPDFFPLRHFSAYPQILDPWFLCVCVFFPPGKKILQPDCAARHWISEVLPIVKALRDLAIKEFTYLYLMQHFPYMFDNRTLFFQGALIHN